VNSQPSIFDWNWHVLMLNQALLGSISNNFKAVVLHFQKDHWLVEVILEKHSESDIEEAQDIVDVMSTFLEDIRSELSDLANCAIRVKTKVAPKRNSYISADQTRMVFWRKED